MKLLHYIAHFLKLHHGIIYSETRQDGIWIGFQCSKCGKVEGLHNATKIIDYELTK